MGNFFISYFTFLYFFLLIFFASWYIVVVVLMFICSCCNQLKWCTHLIWEKFSFKLNHQQKLALQNERKSKTRVCFSSLIELDIYKIQFCLKKDGWIGITFVAISKTDVLLTEAILNWFNTSVWAFGQYHASYKFRTVPKSTELNWTVCDAPLNQYSSLVLVQWFLCLLCLRVFVCSVQITKM